MNNDLQTLRKETILMEESILPAFDGDFESKLADLENDDKVAALLVQDYTGDNMHHIWAELHGQIDPSYQ